MNPIYWVSSTINVPIIKSERIQGFEINSFFFKDYIHVYLFIYFNIAENNNP